ncbi:MAG TPA: MASE1 domain-containing protein, partial [Polyangiales bacterium]
MPSFPAFTQLTYARRAVTIVLLAIVYLGAALLGFRHAIVAEQVTLVWPPSGIALGAVLLLGRWVWPGILLGAFLANLTTEMAVPAASAIAVGNTLEALLAAGLLARADFRLELARLHDVLALVLLAVLASTTVSATIGSGTLVLSGLQPSAALPALWRDWWLGDAV